MPFVHLTRAALLSKIVQGFRSIGTPVERELARAKLPTLLEELPDIYGSTALGWQFVEGCMRLEKLDDPGWLSYGSLSIDDLRPAFAETVEGAASLHQVLERFVAVAPLETTYASWSMRPLKGGIRLEFEHPRLDFVDNVALMEMSQLMGAVVLVRLAAGDDWRPPEVGFIATHRFCDEAQEFLRDTRIRFGQRRTSVTVPADVLDMPLRPRAGRPSGRTHLSVAADAPDLHEAEVLAPIPALRHVLGTYLGEQRPSIELAAEITGTSVRTLQRRLRRDGISFSDLVDQCRYERARTLLADRDVKIIDVALAVGYEDPSHFSRAFRRISGLSPRAYRAGALERLSGSRPSEAVRALPPAQMVPPA